MKKPKCNQTKEPEAPPELDEIMRTILRSPPKHKAVEKPKRPAKRRPRKTE